MPKPKILIIDDEPRVREVLRRALEDAYEVLEAGDGREGLARAREALPHLVLLDIRMPALDGMTVLVRLKLDARTNAIPVVVVSVEGDVDALLEGQQAGASDHLIKPFKLDDLRAVIRRNLLVSEG
ncbi:MAG TPA: response regulator [bacterium]